MTRSHPHKLNRTQRYLISPVRLVYVLRVSGAHEVAGTSVAVYGALKPVGAWNMQSLYFMDDAAVITYQPNSELSAKQHQVVFYFSESLGDGPHSLRIVNMGEQFWLDFIALETPDTATSAPTATNPSSPSPPSLTVTMTLTPATSTGASPSATSKPAVVAGIAAGAAVLLGILSAAAFLYRRRHREPAIANADSVGASLLCKATQLYH